MGSIEIKLSGSNIRGNKKSALPDQTRGKPGRPIHARMIFSETIFLDFTLSDCYIVAWAEFTIYIRAAHALTTTAHA